MGCIEGERVIKISFGLMWYRFTNNWAQIQLLVNQNLLKCKFFQQRGLGGAVFVCDVYAKSTPHDRASWDLCKDALTTKE